MQEKGEPELGKPWSDYRRANPVPVIGLRVRDQFLPAVPEITGRTAGRKIMIVLPKFIPVLPPYPSHWGAKGPLLQKIMAERKMVMIGRPPMPGNPPESDNIPDDPKANPGPGHRTQIA